MKDSYKVDLYIPVLGAFPMVELREILLETNNQILSLSGKILFHEDTPQPVELAFVDRDTLAPEILSNFKFKHVRPFSILHAKALIPIEVFKERFSEYPFNIADLKSELSDEAEQFAVRLNFIANLARPGSFEIESFSIYVNDQFESKAGGVFNHLCVYYAFKQKSSWPVIEFLDLNLVHEWLKGNEDFSNKFGESPLGIALAAYSYHFTRDNQGNENPLNDALSLIALEAVYQSNGSKRELTHKVDLFIGPHQETKSKIDKSYSIRSSLLHGGFKIPFSGCPYDATKNYETWRQKSNLLEEIATLILIRTLQKMATLNIHKINFTIKLET